MTGKITLAMLAFAANSILCRVAIKGLHIDPFSFSTLRLLGGACVLFILLRKPLLNRPVEWRLPNTLFLALYVFAFSLAYIHLGAAEGALLLFGTVQLVMTGWGFFRGERFSGLKCAGIALAVAGIAFLLLPGANSPPLLPASMMVLAGAGWAAYSIAGKSVNNATAATAGSFILATPLAIILSLLLHQSAHADTSGVLLALVSGGLTSGAAYALWYAIVPSLTASTASTVQLSVPCLSALGGALFLGEHLSLLLLVSSATVIAGIAIAIFADKRAREHS
ncbi:DMT family transporter [Enterobacter sp. CC120223-11]|uniref:DMT family transporter n=1 Tax=Enterobacter sp. CC120223-11 TaxID=1378073 RepID=UPI000BCCA363|nr:DMT family transporter [Enterobacter sp. CC120223-11]SNY70289.1 Predicted permease, DMT superfamily [Enterobacter sp. CC120223-11]